MKKTDRILIVKLSAFGDVVQTLFVAESLKKAMPGVFIGWLVSRACKELVEENPWIDRTYIFERHRWAGPANFYRNRREFWALVERMRQDRFGTVLDFQGLFRSAALAVLSGAPRRIGFADARELAPLAYTQKIELPGPSMHAIDRYAALMKTLGEIPVRRSFVLPEIDCGKAGLVERHAGPSIVLVPGARWQNKRWPPCHFARLADLLAERWGARILLVGASSDRSIAEEILSRSKQSAHVRSLVGRTSPKELASVMKGSDLVVSNDSGPMHLAAALGVPTVALFGPTDPVKTGPYGSAHKVLRCPERPCMPCYKRNCTHSEPCLDAISPECVMSVIESEFPSKFAKT